MPIDRPPTDIDCTRDDLNRAAIALRAAETRHHHDLEIAEAVAEARRKVDAALMCLRSRKG